MKIAVITGITGQDGAYLADLLLKKKYKVIGITRDMSKINTFNLDYLNIAKDVTFDSCDLTNVPEIIGMLKKYQPQEIYNLAAQSSVKESFKDPLTTLNFNTMSVASLLESIKIFDKTIKFYQASSSEMFGNIKRLPITEAFDFNPASPYGISKASAHWIAINYRISFDLFITSGILFNHESFLRGEDFIIKKIIIKSLEIKNGRADKLIVGNIDIRRDFGYAPKYVEAMYLMMQHSEPEDYIISSGKSISIREIIYYVFDKLDISRKKIVVDENLFRPNEIKDIYGDSRKAKKKLNWEYDMSFFDVLDLLIEEEKNTKNG